jgi:hypothetical protein
MNYKERFAGLNANEIIKKLEEEAKPFNPLDFGFKQPIKNAINIDVFIKKYNDSSIYYELYYYKKIQKYQLFLRNSPEFHSIKETEANLKIKIPSQRFGRELLENLEVI